jgi:hypothetical protein
MASLTEQLQAMYGLAENWDGYGAAAPEAPVLDLAQELVDLLQAGLRKPPAAAPTLHVSPTRTGGILIEWQDSLTDHEVEINPDGSVSFLHLDRATGQARTRRFIANTSSVVTPGFLRELVHVLAA